MNRSLTKNWIYYLFILLFLTGNSLSADNDLEQTLAPYLLPDNHPIKEKLDHIFGKAGIVSSRSALKDHGFIVNKRRHPNNVLVAWHKHLKGYLLKVYTDDQPQMEDWKYWMGRIHGADVVRNAIDRHGYHYFFKVPRKWMYKLPNVADPKDKQYILVVEDMDTLNDVSNGRCWKNENIVSKELLLALYTILEEEGLIDSVYIDNIPFSIDGRIAFIDTEHVNVWPVKYYSLSPKLSKRNREYWESLYK